MTTKLKVRLKAAVPVLAALSIAATTAEKGQLIEIQNFVNARASARFQSTDDNRIYQLPKGTRAVISEKERIVRFASGNLGLCLQIINAEINKSKDCFWVYFNANANNLKILDVKGPEKAALLKTWKNAGPKVILNDVENKSTVVPAPGLPAIVQKETQAVREVATSKAVASAPAPSNSTDASTQSLLTSIAKKADEISSPQFFSAPPAPESCSWCTKKRVTKYESCEPNNANAYLHNEINEILRAEPDHLVSKILALGSQAQFIKEDCFQGSLISSNGPYKYCAKDQMAVNERGVVPRACADENYTGLIRKSFDAVGECLGDYLSGNKQTARDAMIDLFGMMSIESGLNMNARSQPIFCTVEDVEAGRYQCKRAYKDIKAGGAGGIGQMTGGAIDAVNRNELGLMKSHLEQKSTNPVCKLVMEVMKQPMKHQFEKSCERISLSKGSPIKNIIYSLSYQKILRSEIRGYRLNNKLSAHVFQNLRSDDRDYLERQLSLWAHNSGGGALNDALKSYLRSYVGKNLRDRADVDEFLRGMRQSMRRSNSGRPNIDEPVNFWNRIKTRMKNLNESYGGGSCVVGK